LIFLLIEIEILEKYLVDKAMTIKLLGQKSISQLKTKHQNPFRSSRRQISDILKLFLFFLL